MTLYRQLILILVLVCTLMLMAGMAVNLYNTRLFVTEQLESHAQDTATSLALSLTPHMADADLVMATSMIDAIYDRGYYSEIDLVSNDNRTLLQRHAGVRLDGVPRWFVSLVDLQIPQAEAQVMDGWNLAGVLRVRSHPGFAYRQLWRTFTQMLVWFVAIATAVGVLGAVFIHRLLQPLRSVEKQAEGICQREYVVQEDVPKTRELRQMVTAMNRMTEKVRLMFEDQARTAERMRELAYLDAVTGLGNRRYFNNQLGSALKESEKRVHGALMIVQLNDLKALNDSRGFEAGDTLVKAAAKAIKEATQRMDAVIGRLAGADFGILLPGVDEERLREIAGHLSDNMADFFSQELSMSTDVSHIGVAVYAGSKTPGELLSEADHALRTAQSRGPNQWSVYAALQPVSFSIGRYEWGQRIAGALEHRNIVLFEQPVVSSASTDETFHREIFVRIPAADGSLMAAGAFIPIAEELNLAQVIDQLVIQMLIEHIQQASSPACYAINLSPGSLRDVEFRRWLFEALSRLSPRSGRLVFEFPEFGVIHDLDELHRFSSRVREIGHGFALDHFGQAFSNFGYLHSLRPDYVKIDGGYTTQIIEDRDDQFFVQTLCSIAHSLDIRTIAETVETTRQWQALKTLNVDGIQGYVVGRPEALRQAVGKQREEDHDLV